MHRSGAAPRSCLILSLPPKKTLSPAEKSISGECAGCHGTPGAPDSESTPDSLFPPIPQLPKVGTEYSEAQIFWVAKHGIRRTGMFANGKWDPDQKLWTAAGIKRIKSLAPHVQQELAKKPTPAP